MTDARNKFEKKLAQRRMVAGWLSLFVLPGSVTEVRALEVPQRNGWRSTFSGFFHHDCLNLAAKEAVRLDERRPVGVYFVFNPVIPDMLARRRNRVDRAYQGEVATDQSIVRRHWLLIDADPKRDSKISSNDAEKAAAEDVIRKVRDFLRSRGWTDPILADSGNGYHLLYRIDLPTDDGGQVKRVLLALSQRFDNELVEIDQAVFNPARLTKVYGTVARKGDCVPELGRVHRQSQLLEVAGCADPLDVSTANVQTVPVELLEALASEAKDQKKPTPPPGPRPSRNGRRAGPRLGRLLVEKWLTDRGIGYRVKPGTDGLGRTIYVLSECPFDPSHGDHACVMQDAAVRMSAHCFHDSCQGRGWQQFKQAIGSPEWHHYDQAVQHEGTDNCQETSEPPKANELVDGAATDDGSHTPQALQAPPQVHEADDDPHRLARLFRAIHVRDDASTLWCWREVWYRWRGSAYGLVPEPEIRGELSEFIKAEFDALWQEREMKRLLEADEDSESKPIPVLKVTVPLVTNVLHALAGMSMPRGMTEPPCWLGTDAPFPAGEVLACRNTLVHLPSWADGRPATLPPTPAFFSPNALAYDFDDNASHEPKAWLSFLRQLWPNDPQTIATLQMWFGYCLLPDTSQQKILMLVGPKRSGKGTMARVLRELVGTRNTVAPTLASLTTNFGLWPLLDKTVAIISDARLSGRTDAAVVVERLLSISGEDAQTVDRKNLSPVTPKLAVRFTILTNELARLNATSGALVGRLIILRLVNSWYDKEDTKLTDKLLAELPQILLWAMDGWRKLRAAGRFPQPDSSAALVQDMEDLASPIGQFVRECCVLDVGAEVPMRDLFSRWREWCAEKGRKEHGTEQTLGRDLRAFLPALGRRRLRDGSERKRLYTGIRLRTNDDENEEPAET
jgi:putative DNA primase/helicase